MNSVTAKLDIQKHIYIGGILFHQIMRELQIGKKDGYIMVKSAFEVTRNEIKNHLDENDSIMVLLTKILSNNQHFKNLELIFKFFALLEEDAKLLNLKDNLYELEEEEDFYFGNR